MIKFNNWRLLNEELDKPYDAAEAAPASVSPTITPQTSVGTPTMKPKPWKAGKEEILRYWKGLQTNIPIAVKPVEYDHKGTTIQEDGLRITGSKEFIASVISRLKDFLFYENPNDKLMVSYRQSPKSFTPGNKNSYSLYLQVKERGKK